jgi:ribosome maturation factor RimP
MIDKQTVLSAVASAIEGTNLFIVDVNVSADKSVVVEIDSPENLDIETCTNLTRKIEELLPAELEDYDLEVGSAGLTAPFKVRGQWEKNVGNEIELLTNDGRKLSATLVSLADDDFTIEYQVKEKVEGKKRPELVTKSETIPFANVKKANYLLNFK